MKYAADNRSFTMQDIIDSKALTSLLEDLYRTTGSPLTLIDPDGKVLACAGRQRICTKFHLNDQHTHRQCIADCRHFRPLAKDGLPAVHRCPFGLVLLRAPLVINSHNVAELVVCQLLTDLLTDNDLVTFARQAEALGFDKEKYLDALAEVPVIPTDRLRTNLLLCARLTAGTLERGQTGLQLAGLQRKLEESEQRYQSLFHDNHCIILIIDPKSRAIIDANNKACRYYGYSRNQLTSLKISDINILPETELANAIRKAESGSSGYFQCRHRLSSGQIRDVEVYSGPINIDGRTVLYSIVHDITQRKKLDNVLRRSRDEWEKTFDAIDDIVTIQDCDMRIVRANLAASRMFRLSPAALIGKRCHEVFRNSPTACDGCPVFKTLQDYRKHSELMRLEEMDRVYAVSCSPLLDEYGELEFLVHTATDITEKIRLEEDLIRLAAAIEQATESVVITDADGAIQYVNPAFEVHTGYSREEAIGKNPRILKSDRHNPAFYQKMWDTISRGEVWIGHIINKKKDGTLFEEDASISPILDSSGRITNFVAVKRDVTREVSLERQLHQAMKMEAIGTLAGGIAHDFNNILSAILGYGQMARAQLPADSPIRDDLERILIAGQRAADLVKQILTFSRQDKEQMAPVKIQSIIKEVLKLLRASLPSTIRIEKKIDPDCGAVLADPAKIHQVLMNLCTNAKYAMGNRDGVLGVSLSVIDTGHLRLPGCPHLEPGRYADLMVSDTGCGMDRNTREMIFDPFFTTRERGQGTGLGLAVVHGIVKKCGGEITVTSEVDRGTVFHIYLPLIHESTGEMHEQKTSVPGGTERILVIDDDAEIADLERRMLSELGYRVTMFSDSEEALASWRKNPGDYDLVLTDMTMPKINGAELARQILAKCPEVPIILCTGFSEVMDQSQARELGIKGYLMKPVLLRELAARIREVLDGDGEKTASPPVRKSSAGMSRPS